MRLCRFNSNRLGIVEGEEVVDVTGALEVLPAARYPLPVHDLLIEHLDRVIERARALAPGGPRLPLGSVRLESPVANPSKIINAPVNYEAHIEEAKHDKVLAQGTAGRKTSFIGDWGLFLKANSALVGCGTEMRLRMPERRSDHEVELAVIIGRTANRVRREDALAHVAGYSIGLDMSVRGQEDRSFRKSIDTYAVLGPWLVTPDEVPDPNRLDLSLSVNGELRQSSNTSRMVFDVGRLIEYASAWYTLLPGDIILTGTPEGVGGVKPGDVIHARIERIGAFDMRVAGAYDG
ncbi:MAG: fumarylacetoacetate hydrolase family protein [Burkholderiales bacterium]|nr:fumarylacetoacetate hydrolase family protein [Burkholderiales bacterium]